MEWKIQTLRGQLVELGSAIHSGSERAQAPSLLTLAIEACQPKLVGKDLTRREAAKCISE